MEINRENSELLGILGKSEKKLGTFKICGYFWGTDKYGNLITSVELSGNIRIVGKFHNLLGMLRNGRKKLGKFYDWWGISGNNVERWGDFISVRNFRE